MRVERHEIIDNWTRIKSEWILIRDSSVQLFEYCVRVYSGQELTDLLRDVGFGDVVLYGDLNGRSYGPRASRLIARAEGVTSEPARLRLGSVLMPISYQESVEPDALFDLGQQVWPGPCTMADVTSVFQGTLGWRASGRHSPSPD